MLGHRSLKQKHTHTHTNTHKHGHTLTHTRTHTHTQRHARTDTDTSYTHTHTHTHPPICMPYNALSLSTLLLYSLWIYLYQGLYFGDIYIRDYILVIFISGI